MGKKWDIDVPSVEIWKEAIRVLKPGGHLISFGGTRTYHRMAVAIEDAGFEIRDMIAWVYGSGFPKSLNIGKQEGCEDWEGWGTALKPAQEPCVLARKPLSEKTVAENVLKWGTGGLNIDGSRVGMSQGDKEMLDAKASTHNNGVNFDVGEGKAKGTATPANNLGRFPANLIHDGGEEVVGLFPHTKSGNLNAGHKRGSGVTSYDGGGGIVQKDYGGDQGSAARFFYCAKASKKERNRGCEDMEGQPVAWGNQAKAELKRGNLDFKANGDATKHNKVEIRKNHHPTVKPIALMEYLIKLVTPPNGTVLDPFMGSGSTGIAAKNLGHDFIGIEREEEYVEIAKARVGQ